MAQKIIAQACFRRPITIPHDGTCVLAVTARLIHIQGNARPHFSLTCWVTKGRRDISGGADHETILRYFPELAPLAALHLSDDTGAPMHDVENAWYWAGGTQWRDKTPDAGVLAGHLRVGVSEAYKIVDNVVGGKWSKEHLREHIEGYRERWKAEADAGMALIRDLASRTVAGELQPKKA